MKRTIITLFIISLTVLMASAQTAEDFHFVADGGSVRWQLVYESQAESTNRHWRVLSGLSVRLDAFLMVHKSPRKSMKVHFLVRLFWAK